MCVDDEMDLDEDFPENVRPGGHGELVMNIVSPSNIQADATKVSRLTHFVHSLE